jgi:hypothetical protein
MSKHIEKEQALNVTHAGNFFGRGRGRGSFRGRGRGRGRGTGEGIFDKAFIECYNCHKIGHFQWECPYKRAEKANFAEIKEKEEMLLMAYTENNLAGNGAMWYLDSGCSNHMTKNKSLFL